MLGRREFLQLGVLAGITGLAGCGRTFSQPTLRAAAETLPKELLETLPKPWIFKKLTAKKELGPSKLVIDSTTDLVAIGDGWISELSDNAFTAIGSEQIFSRLDKHSQFFLQGFGQDFLSKILPVAFSPWVMLFRNGKNWISRASGKDGWSVLLEPELAGSVVLPSSPRLVISLAERINQADSLRKLRTQALTFDDRNSLNWVLSGRARVAVLPLNRCFRSLTRDPRLNIALPQSGAPLNWTVLMRPAQTTEPFPEDWLEAAWEMPLLGKLFARGWIPPITHSERLKATNRIPINYQQILFPAESFWEKCWSLPLLSIPERNRLESLWAQSTP
ncbi:ABC transporter substrate-binding protein [Prochlorococcus sp. MIT 1307]|uniref:ABC transporter substrate-binding protein n=1 Tax=Prochlorococcus sp. MIT 1307 TaxID=3096219 RepID=UPI002A757807|nr:ABC transporter substrate-binding protein [Prochlorococcus sp. MIT 1307]